MKKDRKLFIEIYCAKVAVFLCAVIICVVLFITRDTTEMVIGFFDEQPSFDYRQFLSENAIKEMFGDKGGFAFCKDALIYYENGEYKKTDVALCFLENDVLYINSGEHGKCTPEELAAKLKAKYVVYDDSLAVFSYKEENQPRTSSTGGTGAVVAVNRGENSFNIVQIGDADLNGLLKSVKQDGTWEGSVYLAPFRTAIEVNNIDYTKKSGVYIFDKINGMQYGDQVELTFHAKYTGKGNAQAKIEVYHAGCLISEATAVYDVTNRETPYRYVFSNQLALEDIEIRLSIECEDNSNFEIEHLECTAQKEQAAHKYFGDTDCATSKGGVSFDIIE